MLQGVVASPSKYRLTATDRLDHILTHRFWGTLLFAVVMLVMFQSVFVWAQPFKEGIDSALRFLALQTASHLGPGALRSLLVDGVLGGVGGVLTFVPQILVLFLFLGILEDCGYMARAAYLMDALMVRAGLSGKSFVPLLSSFACAVPGIMATRVIENERDRLTTILVAPLMTCSARLPIYALLIAAFIPDSGYLGGLLHLRGLTLAGLYLLGIAVAVIAAKLFKRTLLRGDPPPFLMELPTYKWPSPCTVLLRVAERAFSFVRVAGTLILAVSIVVWAALYYPHAKAAISPETWAHRESVEVRLTELDSSSPQYAALSRELGGLDREIAGAYQRQSYLGRFGRTIEPVFRPLGWDWRIGSAVIASFPAREIVVATLGVVFNADDLAAGGADRASPLRMAVREDTGQPLFNGPVALSIMVFYALCAVRRHAGGHSPGDQ